MVTGLPAAPVPPKAFSNLKPSKHFCILQFNVIEREAKTLKAGHLAHETFKNWDDLKIAIAIAIAIEAINSTRKSHPLAKRRIFA